MKKLPGPSYVLVLLLFVSTTVSGQNNFLSFSKQGQKAFRNSDFEKAILYFQQAISSFGPREDSVKLGECYLYLGLVYGKNENYRQSEQYTVKATRIFSRFRNDTLLLRSYNVLGNILVMGKKNEEALEVYQKCLRMADSLHFYSLQESLHINTGVIRYNQGNYHEAIRQYEKALDIARNRNSQYGIGLSLINMGISYHGLGQDHKAIDLISQGMVLAKEINDLYILETGYEQMAEVYFSLGEYRKSCEYLRLFITTKDSVRSTEINKRMVELETKYHTQRNELEILHLKNEKQKNEITTLESNNKIASLKYILVACIVALITIVVVSVLFYRQYKNKALLSARLSQSKEELEKKNSALIDSLALNTRLQNALKQDLDNYKQLAYRKQMNPHFIFNSLNSVQNYILTNEKLQANYYLGELSALIRRVLENSEKDQITLKEELLVCETYIRLEQKRFDEKFSYTISHDPDLDLCAIELPPLLLQPFIENAIWHGLLHKDGNASLQINVLRTGENAVTISIKDNGVGRSSARKNAVSESKLRSMGINLTMERISLNNYLHNTGISLRIKDLFDADNNPCGTEVFIVLQPNHPTVYVSIAESGHH